MTEFFLTVLPVPGKSAGKPKLARSQPDVKPVRLRPTVGEGSGHEAPDDELFGAGRREASLPGMFLLLALSEHALYQSPRRSPGRAQNSDLDPRGESLDEPFHLQHGVRLLLLLLAEDGQVVEKLLPERERPRDLHLQQPEELGDLRAEHPSPLKLLVLHLPSVVSHLHRNNQNWPDIPRELSQRFMHSYKLLRNNP